MEAVVRKARVIALMFAAVVLANEGYRAARAFYDQFQAMNAELARLRSEVHELRTQGGRLSARSRWPVQMPGPLADVPLPLPLPSPVVHAPSERKAAVALGDEGAGEPAVVLASELKNAPTGSTLNVKLLGEAP